MKVLQHAVILKVNERCHRKQYRIPVSLFGKYPKGSTFRIEVRSVDNGESLLACLTHAPGAAGKSVYRVTTRGQLVFTPPADIIPPESGGRKKPRYKTFQAAELPFE